MPDPAYYLDPLDAPVDSDPGLTTIGIMEADEIEEELGEEVYYPEGEEDEDAYVVSVVNDQASPDGYD